MLRFAVLAAAVGVAAVAFAEARPPACGPTTAGVMWNFGTDAKPDIRRCDGTSYLPYALPCSDTPAPASSAPPSNANAHQACEADCDNARARCEEPCRGIFTDTQCVDRCARARAQCGTRCPN